MLENTKHMRTDKGCTHLTVPSSPVQFLNFWHYCLCCLGMPFPCLSEPELILISYTLEAVESSTHFSLGIIHWGEQLGIAVYVVVWVSTNDDCEPGVMFKTKQKNTKKIRLHLYVQEPASIALTKNKPLYWHILLKKTWMECSRCVC